MAAISGITLCATDTRDNIGPQTVKRSTGDRDVFLGDADGWVVFLFLSGQSSARISRTEILRKGKNNIRPIKRLFV